MTELLVRATPFHARAADANRLNAWTARCGRTLAKSYGDANDEALAARLGVVMADISWRWRVMIEGARANEFVSRLLTRDAAKLSPGCALKALWLNDKGAMRGGGIIARFGRDAFLLAAAAPDMEWIAASAALFDVRVRDMTQIQGGLAIVGPYAAKLIAAAGLGPNLEALAFRKSFWGGLDITLSRFGEHGGYELWCEEDDALLVWDRIARAGEAFGVRAAGVDAMDILDLEAGIPRPGRDYDPAAEPSPHALDLDALVAPDHLTFNGRAAFLATAKTKTSVGVELDSDTPAPHTPLMKAGRIVGHTLSSLYSPALRRAIALAEIEVNSAAPGTPLTLTLASPTLHTVTGRIIVLPFLPTSDPISQ